MPFSVPMVLREQKDHLTDCCLCFTKTDGNNSKSKHNIVFPNTPDDSPPISTPPQQWTLHEEEATSTSAEDESGPFKFQFPGTNCTSSYIVF